MRLLSLCNYEPNSCNFSFINTLVSLENSNINCLMHPMGSGPCPPLQLNLLTLSPSATCSTVYSTLSYTDLPSAPRACQALPGLRAFALTVFSADTTLPPSCLSDRSLKRHFHARFPPITWSKTVLVILCSTIPFDSLLRTYYHTIFSLRICLLSVFPAMGSERGRVLFITVPLD